MIETPVEIAASTLRITYDSTQHAVVLQEPQGKATAMDACTATGGKGEEFSPTNLMASGLAGCMLFSMGVLALRDGLDLTGTTVEVAVEPPAELGARLGAIRLTFTMPRIYTVIDRVKLERAAEACPIHHSFHPQVPVTAIFQYPN